MKYIKERKQCSSKSIMTYASCICAYSACACSCSANCNCGSSTAAYYTSNAEMAEKNYVNDKHSGKYSESVQTI